ncbi:acyl-CoA dehydrogenase [Frankia sp. R43]|uniref:acyl-CoA dehydrogenase family protein n=1 Tax=Frankia sp. R43 TaxID=269536 RepID=UPI0006C9EBA4|nr:acyl-CoA dehydrogenase family protein [Frankia sp. R43]KPM52095.1 acyl-CoA dehydrogenase [Frankia sp. R43]
MRFSLSPEQGAFAAALDDLLTASDVPAAHRAWADGETGPGIALWERLAKLGVTALAIGPEHGGLGGSPLDLAVAFERLGYHAVPGPWVETVALAPVLLRTTADEHLLPEIADGAARVTFALPPTVPYALDCDVTTHAYLVDSVDVVNRVADRVLLRGRPGEALRSVDPARRLHVLTGGAPVAGLREGTVRAGLDRAALAAAAILVGAGERLLAESVRYVGARRQFGRAIGEYQAVKHALADVRVALDFARPLLHGAALELAADTTGEAGAGAATAADSATAAREVSAAKVLASTAALRAARTALQVHGAIGYTLECDLSIWILGVRALVGAWGTPADHRARVLRSLMSPTGA